MTDLITIQTAATPFIGAAAPRVRLSQWEMRDLALRPLFIARLAMRYAEELRVHLFTPSGAFKKASRLLHDPCEELEKRLCNSMPESNRREMWYIEHRFYQDTRQACELLRINADGYMKATAPDLSSTECNIFARCAVLTLLCEDIEISEELSFRQLIRAADHRLYQKLRFTDFARSVRKAADLVTDIINRDVPAEVNKRAKDALKASCRAFSETLDRTPIAVTRQHRVCGTCKHYEWEVSSRGSCRVSCLAKTHQDRKQCKRYISVSPPLPSPYGTLPRQADQGVGVVENYK